MKSILYSTHPSLSHFVWFCHKIRDQCQWIKNIDWDYRLWPYWAIEHKALAIIVYREGNCLLPDTGLIYRRGSFSQAEETGFPRELYANPGGPDIWVDFCSGSYRNALGYLA